ncbi:hypothetical protein SAMD00023353_8000210 [Rosellinia necatrix]|uniref:Gpi anchored protein n=1 Tax=Rosellinia necatrix TaxID=77044 RepID=A0A1W2TUS0_ROSNE|nr:hypothetical protein SAMD00023353_8000210 [Rosellinia necatrix]
MQTKIFATIFFFAALGAAQDVDLDDDIPQACLRVCQDISTLSNDCDNQTNSDSAERDCVCNANNAQQQANSCAACVKANIPTNDDDDDYDDDLRELFRACGWNYDDVSATTTSGTASSTNGGSTTTTETIPASTTTQTTNGITTTQTIPATTVTSAGPASTTSTDAAAGVTAGVGIIAAGLMAALPIIL